MIKKWQGLLYKILYFSANSRQLVLTGLVGQTSFLDQFAPCKNSRVRWKKMERFKNTVFHLKFGCFVNFFC